MLITTQMGGRVVSLLWYVSLLTSAVAGLYAYDFNLEKKTIILFLFVLMTGVVNYYVIGTTTLKDQALNLMLGCVSLLMTSKYANERALLAILAMNEIIVLYKFATVGLWGQVYTSASTNFVSVYLLYPAVVYYCLCERNGGKISFAPAVSVWVLCLLARGRGGIIVATFFLLGVFLCCYKNTYKRQKLIVLCMGIALAAIVILNIDKIGAKLINSVAFEYFLDRGLKSSSRMSIWSNYLFHALGSEKSLLLGPAMKYTEVNINYKGNPHNSFINIHMNNGLLMLIAVVGILIINTIKGIKENKPIFVICLITIMARAFTDSIFWTTYGTAVLFFFLLYDSNSLDNSHISEIMNCNRLFINSNK